VRRREHANHLLRRAADLVQIENSAGVEAGGASPFWTSRWSPWLWPGHTRMRMRVGVRFSSDHLVKDRAFNSHEDAASTGCVVY
jgi:hypothetical protein